MCNYVRKLTSSENDEQKRTIRTVLYAVRRNGSVEKFGIYAVSHVTRGDCKTDETAGKRGDTNQNADSQQPQWPIIARRGFDFTSTSKIADTIASYYHNSTSGGLHPHSLGSKKSLDPEIRDVPGNEPGGLDRHSETMDRLGVESEALHMGIFSPQTGGNNGYE